MSATFEFNLDSVTKDLAVVGLKADLVRGAVPFGHLSGVVSPFLLRFTGPFSSSANGRELDEVGSGEVHGVQAGSGRSDEGKSEFHLYSVLIDYLTKIVKLFKPSKDGKIY